MAIQRNTDNYLLNQFILFYTLRHLWKLNKHPVSGLYEILFPSKNEIGGNKTLYDNILREEAPYKIIVGHAKRLEMLTGLKKECFTGERGLSIPSLINEDWYEFVMLRKKSKTVKSDTLKELEGKIKREIHNAKKMNPSALNEPLRLLIYFAEYKHKREEKTLEDLFREIESKIGECHPRDFEKASLQLLEKHQRAIQEHLYHIAAVITINKWKGDI